MRIFRVPTPFKQTISSPSKSVPSPSRGGLGWGWWTPPPPKKIFLKKIKKWRISLLHFSKKPCFSQEPWCPPSPPCPPLEGEGIRVQKNERKYAGFTLLELAIALFIIALLLGGLLPSLSGRVEQQRLHEARAQLDEIHQAAIGYAIANGRLPCPASAASSGTESYAATGNATNGACSNPYNGYAPAATLGIANTNGYAIDPWGNRIRYAVATANSNAYTHIGGITNVTSLAPNLVVCSTAVGIGASTCATGTLVANGVPLVIYSTGGNGAHGGQSADETANLNPTASFVSHAPTAAGSSGGEFDDIVSWLSPNVLYARLAEAGKLP